ncbi:hypothetical protein [uncultured Meiothermus sp.]|uniref:hypothetical protein n=1 Tax=uncultured Meiothermus sp. TaxID=157471 RepID=UPI00261E9BDD|nr:hypothetical protein [uncultured Meiothermus sp.]
MLGKRDRENLEKIPAMSGGRESALQISALFFGPVLASNGGQAIGLKTCFGQQGQNPFALALSCTTPQTRA